MKSNLLTIAAATLMLAGSIEANAYDTKRTPSFPGAEGYGMYVTGGRGGAVYHVTSLADDGSVGTLRYAVNQSGARTIVFDVSGTIYLTSQLNIGNGDLTIAGQTAPGDGICIADWPVVVKGNNVILRYLRFRLGNTYVSKTDGDGGHEGDGLGGVDGANIMVDHCTVSWSIDECMAIYGNRNTTVQWCMAYESLREAGHSKGAHGYGAMMGGGKTSYHHNLIAHHDSRTPRFVYRSGDETSKENPTDYRNNVIYNYGKNGCYGGEEMNINIVNNYYKPGPFTKMQRESYQKRIAGVGNGTHYDSDGNVSEYVWGHYYVNGNKNSAWSDVTNDNWNIGFLNQISSDLKVAKYAWGDITADTIKMSEPMPFALVTTHTADNAYNKVLSYAGASLKRDALDQVIANDAKNGTATYSADAKTRPGIINSPTEAKTDASSDSAWPTLVSEEALTDTDGDGMPDNWEIANGLNPDDASDGPVVTDDGYTNLEHYLNSLVSAITEAQLADGEVQGEDIASTGALNHEVLDSTKAITVPSNEYFNMNYVAFQQKNGSDLGNVNYDDGDYEMIENIRTGQTATFIVDVTKEGTYKVEFKGCTKRDNVSTKWNFTVDNEDESSNDVAIKNNGSWGKSGESWDDYSFTTSTLTPGLKKLVILFSSEKYTANIAQIKMTLAATDGISEVSFAQPTSNGKKYNLAGQQVANGYKGIVISNGRKIISK